MIVTKYLQIKDKLVYHPSTRTLHLVRKKGDNMQCNKNSRSTGQKIPFIQFHKIHQEYEFTNTDIFMLDYKNK